MRWVAHASYRRISWRSLRGLRAGFAGPVADAAAAAARFFRRSSAQILGGLDIERGMESRADDNRLEEFLSPEEVAHACRLSRRAIYRAIARGELPAARLCHRLRVHPADLERWIAARMVPDGGAQAAAPPRPRTARRERGSLRAMLDGTD